MADLDVTLVVAPTVNVIQIDLDPLDVAISSANAATAAAAAAAGSATAVSGELAAATAQAVIATAQATSATGSAATATAQAVIATAQATSAASSATALTTGLASFNKQWLGPHASDPTLDNQGNALQIGAAYENTTAVPPKIRIYTSTGWQDQDATAEAASASATLAATQAATSATNSAASATTATGAATTATTEAGIATTQAGNAAASATTATTEAGISTTQAGNASASATTATTEAGIATTQAGNASASATGAAASAATATTQATNAGTSATTASGAASTATAAATTATTEAGIATTQAGNASASATTATTEAGIATTQATNAAASATAAAASASSAAGAVVSVNGVLSLNLTGASTTLSGSQAGNAIHIYTGSITVGTVNLPMASHPFTAYNNTAGPLTMAATGGAAQVVIPQGLSMELICDGATGILQSTNAIANPTFSGNVGMPTRTSGDSTANGASTAFVAAAIAPMSQRNRAVNGACVVAQRGAIAVSSGISGYGGPDQYEASIGSGAAGAFTQSAGTITYGGIALAAVVQTVTTGTSAPTGSGYWFGICQPIEGVNCFDMLGHPAVISTIFEASLAGTYSVSLRDGNTNSFVSTFVAAANTAIKISIPVASLPTNLSTANSNTAGLYLQIGALCTGTFQTSTLNAWQPNNVFVAAGATNWAATANNYIALTQLKLEKGTVATPFDDFDFDIELLRCMRYFEQFTTIIGFACPSSGGFAHIFDFRHKAVKRTIPTMSIYFPSYSNISNDNLENADVYGWSESITGTAQGNVQVEITASASAVM